MSKLFTLVACVILTACATTFKVVQLPLRDADLYPLSQTKGAITVAVDEISNPERVHNYFGVDLLEAGIIAINIVVSNHGRYQSTIKPADLLARNINESSCPAGPLGAISLRRHEANLCTNCHRARSPSVS